jgi:hypothetical protein
MAFSESSQGKEQKEKPEKRAKGEKTTGNINIVEEGRLPTQGSCIAEEKCRSLW